MLRWIVAAAVALAAIWFGFVDNDWLDRRPVQRILYLGDSYTYYNDLPAMVAEMADSAGSDVRFDITMRAFPNAKLEDHWNNETTRSLLAQGDWDRVMVQPESYFQELEGDHSHFRLGSRLFEAAGRAQRAIVVSWTASEDAYQNRPMTRAEHFQNIETNHRGLASRTGAGLIDVARVWRDVEAEALPFSLYQRDGNHPSLEGSYLAGLVIYAQLAQRDVQDVTYVPWRMRGEDAALLRERVQRSLHAHGMAGG